MNNFDLNYVLHTNAHNDHHIPLGTYAYINKYLYTIQDTDIRTHTLVQM